MELSAKVQRAAEADLSLCSEDTYIITNDFSNSLNLPTLQVHKRKNESILKFRNKNT